MRHFQTILACILAFSGLVSYGASGDPAHPSREVRGQVIFSKALPAIEIHVAEGFTFVGAFDFKIRDAASGTRYIFADADENFQIRRLIIAQFEAFLPDSGQTYRYDLSSGELMAGYRFRGNPYAFSNLEAKTRNPEGEAACTARFLAAKGFRFNDLWRMYRWLTVPDQSKRHELILFYVEPEPDPAKTIGDFYTPAGLMKPYWDALARTMKDASRNAWTLKPLSH